MRVVAGGVGAGGGRRGRSRSPRVLEPRISCLIMADDLGWGDVGFNGRTEWSTPNLDALARQGRVLKRCYTAAVVCAPSRAAFLTGKFTIHSGVRRNDEDLPAEEVTIAEALKPLGYTTALFGKWHHGKPRAGRTIMSIRWTRDLTRSSDIRTPSMPGRSFPASFGTVVSGLRSPGTSTT